KDKIHMNTHGGSRLWQATAVRGKIEIGNQPYALRTVPASDGRSMSMLYQTPSEILHKRIRNIGTVIVGHPCRLSFNFFHQTIEIVTRVGNADDADRGAVPQPGGVELCDRNVEAGAQAVFEAAYDLTFVLERLRGFDVEFEGEKSHH